MLMIVENDKLYPNITSLHSTIYSRVVRVCGEDAERLVGRATGYYSGSFGETVYRMPEGVIFEDNVVYRVTVNCNGETYARVASFNSIYTKELYQALTGCNNRIVIVEKGTDTQSALEDIKRKVKESFPEYDGNNVLETKYNESFLDKVASAPEHRGYYVEKSLKQWDEERFIPLHE